ncbi:uncharacterized protein LOC115924836 [Strongylocentrotus purpuratus]|uniref:Sushi domain-containing protein n=1 Tax=Strongylocentrotus purpuratus TaxID=7668 RepID=A0A7M7NYU0_STRPU|nr:uncharacterized protein LOC115924836 [Strongylocentrotus purpuratus]
MLSPDQEAYMRYDSLDISCEEDHTSSTLPRNFDCQYNEIWYPDPSNYLCFAQCDTTKLLDNDVIAEKPNNGGPQTVFNHGDSAIFNCQGGSRFTGQNTATCVNGSFDFDTKPECLDPCPISQQNLDKDLSYSIVEDPVINETQTLYYRDGVSIMFSCRDGNIPEHCQGVCHDGSWDPGDFPSCIALEGKLTTGAVVGIAILTILLVASIIIIVGLLIFLERARSKDADTEPFSYKFNKNGSVEHVMNNNGHNNERLVTLSSSSSPHSSRHLFFVIFIFFVTLSFVNLLFVTLLFVVSLFFVTLFFGSLFFVTLFFVFPIFFVTLSFVNLVFVTLLFFVSLFFVNLFFDIFIFFITFSFSSLLFFVTLFSVSLFSFASLFCVTLFLVTLFFANLFFFFVTLFV